MSGNIARDMKRGGWRRYLIEFGVASGAYGVTVPLSIFLVQRTALEGAAAVAAGMLPVVPALLMLWAFLRQFWRMDELQRRVVSEAMTVAAGVVGFVSFALGWALLVARPPHPGLGYFLLLMVLPAMILVWGLALVFVGRRYK